MHGSSCTVRLQLLGRAGLVDSKPWCAWVIFSWFCMSHVDKRGSVRGCRDHNTRPRRFMVTNSSGGTCNNGDWVSVSLSQFWACFKGLYCFSAGRSKARFLNLGILAVVSHVDRLDRGERETDCTPSNEHQVTPSGEVATEYPLGWTVNREMVDGSWIPTVVGGMKNYWSENATTEASMWFSSLLSIIKFWKFLGIPFDGDLSIEEKFLQHMQLNDADGAEQSAIVN